MVRKLDATARRAVFDVLCEALDTLGRPAVVSYPQVVEAMRGERCRHHNRQEWASALRKAGYRFLACSFASDRCWSVGGARVVLYRRIRARDIEIYDALVCLGAVLR